LEAYCLSLEEALGYHGLTRETVTAEMIRWTDSIRLESPALYDAIMYDPPEIKRRMGIKTYDFAFSTGMTTDYPVRRGWNHFMGVRELVQNALDIEERLFGYEGISVKIWVDDLGLHIADRGPGITYDAFKLGGSDKGCFERGFFGEGLKVAMAFFAHVGEPIYVFNRRGQVFKAVVSPGTELVIIAMGRANPVTGTEAVVYGHRPDVESVRRTIFQEWMKEPNFYVVSKTMRMTDACRFNKPHFIISHVDRKSNVDFLWVRDISVNKLSALTRHPSIFGYNIWWVTLEPNRVAVSSIPELAKEIALSFTPEAVEELLNRVVSESSISRGLFEVEDVNWWYVSDGVKDKVAAWIKERNYGWTDNERAVDWAIYLGVKPLIVPYTMTELFGGAQTLEDVIMVKGMERIEVAEGSVVSRENLTLKEACYLRGAEIVLTDIHISLVGVDKPMPAILAVDKMDVAGAATVDRIYIHRDSLYSSDEALRTALHEYGHYYGRRTYREARDLSEAFERSLTTIAAEAARISAEARQAYDRAVSGAWGAKAHEWKAGRYRRIDPLSIRLNDALRLQLERLFNIPEARVNLTRDIRYRIDESPPLMVTVSLSKTDEELIMKDGYVEIDYTHYTSEHEIGDIMAWRIPYPRLDLYMAAVERTLKRTEAEKPATEPTRTHIIFLYNPANDVYDVWRSIRRRM
jgi:hypothetical protein